METSTEQTAEVDLTMDEKDQTSSEASACLRPKEEGELSFSSR